MLELKGQGQVVAHLAECKYYTGQGSGLKPTSPEKTAAHSSLPVSSSLSISVSSKIKKEIDPFYFIATTVFAGAQC